MKISELYEYLEDQRPKLIHISGKTSVGKTTLANKLAEKYSYHVIQLDKIVLKYVIDKFKLEDSGQPFIEVYRNRDKKEWIKSFIEGVHSEIESAAEQDKPVILEGAVANTDTLKELLEPYPRALIIYLHPTDIDQYSKNLVSRFEMSTPTDGAGLPSKFWSLMKEDEIAQYHDTRVITPELYLAINNYAKESRKESKRRLAAITGKFKNTLVVEM